MDGLEDSEVVWLRGALVPGSAGARTLVAMVAAVVRGPRWVVMVATLRVEVEELWFWAPWPSSGPVLHCCTCPAAAVKRVVLGATRHWHESAGEGYPRQR